MLDKKDLPLETQERLNYLLAKDTNDLTQDDVTFLNARRDYLTSEEKTRTLSVKKEVVAEEQANCYPVYPVTNENPNQESVVKPTKKPKKVTE